MNDDFDVVVVGAGPAGSTAAEYAALGGSRVLVIEKRRNIGEPVACGEFMPSAHEVKSIFPQANALEELFSIPRSLISREMGVFRLFSPSRRSWDVPFEGYTTDRDRFDRFLASKAEKAGARLLTKVRCIEVSEGTVKTDAGDFSAKAIIGADGPLSTVARSLGLPKVREMYPATTVQAKGNFEPVMEMYFGGVAPGAYAWVLPKREGANVGIGFSPRWAKGTLSQYLTDFVQRRGLQTEGKPRGKMVPASGPVERTVSGKGMIVGDAAGQVMAVNGGGIPIAMICGRIAGQVAASNVKNGMLLKNYEREWRRQVEKPLRTAVHTKMLASLAFGSDSRVDLSMFILGRRRMGNMLRCRKSFP